MERGFPPIEEPDAEVLFLGTGPSKVSLQKMEYYGHPSNAFWPIMARCFGGPIESYAQKRELLISHHVALWDTLSCFERVGSLDSGYRKVEPNDLVPFIKSHVNLKAVAFTGKKAEEFYKRFIAFYPKGLVFQVLPSPSAANTLPVASKYRVYAEFLSSLGLRCPVTLPPQSDV